MTGQVGVAGYDGLTLKEVYLICMGYEDRVTEQRKQTRLLMFTMVKMMGDSKSGINSPEQLWPLPGDEDQEKVKQVSQDEIKEKIALFKKQGYNIS